MTTIKNAPKLLLAACATFCVNWCTILPAHADYVTPTIRHEPFGDMKVVVPLTSSDPHVWQFRLANIANGMRVTAASGGSMQVKVVVYGGAVGLLKQPVGQDLRAALDAARAAGVQIEVCNLSLKGGNIDWHELYGVQEADIVPSGFGEVSFLASHGWVLNAAN